MTATLDLHDIQGGILRGYGYPFATYLFLRDVPPAALAALDVETAEEWASKPEVAVNVALTATGLEALGVDTDGFPPEFRDGMAARAARLRDDPATYEEGLRGTGEAHVLVVVQGRRSASVHAAAAEVLARGGELVHRQDAALLPFGREHFGFNDGFAQPSVFGSGQENRPGEGVPLRFARWRLLRPGEIVLGYEDEDGVLPAAPPKPLHRNATFMVVRKLHQDVAAWRSWLRDAADAWAGGDEEWVAAKVCGRWTDGTPTALEPDPSKLNTIDERHAINAFRYGRDPDGLRCPVGAHVRRVNPRDGLSGGANRTRRHRIIRRGMPYGPPLHGDTDDGVGRGLLFACFNASIARQFEVVQHWSVEGNVFGLGVGNRDFLTGGGDGTQPFVIPGAPPVRLDPPGRPFVQVRGGEYLYAPSISGLRELTA
jgi:Dyp-type peroxidase family